MTKRRNNDENDKKDEKDRKDEKDKKDEKLCTIRDIFVWPPNCFPVFFLIKLWMSMKFSRKMYINQIYIPFEFY